MKKAKPINLQNKLETFSKNWHPHKIAEVDGMNVLLAKLKGEFVWHKHEEQDELFQVIKGTLYMQIKDVSGSDDVRTEKIKEGEIIVIPKGVEHNPFTKNGEEVEVLLFESKTTAHTGDVVNELTQTDYPEI
ncbi:MAG: cupin domain-containing protein [Flavobacteriaceae bacterium]|nr:cupin domain-containing protein [Flavobacteriaceae bacterium]